MEQVIAELMEMDPRTYVRHIFGQVMAMRQDRIRNHAPLQASLVVNITFTHLQKEASHVADFREYRGQFPRYFGNFALAVKTLRDHGVY